MLIVLQFFPGKMPEVIVENPADIQKHVNIDASISRILTTACYDCHSNETDYPWYDKVAPVSWWVDSHVEEGREELNFSEWANYTEKRKHHKMEELIEEVGDGEMPLSSYTWIHRDASLTDQQRDELIAWAKDYMTHLKPGDN